MILSRQPENERWPLGVALISDQLESSATRSGNTNRRRELYTLTEHTPQAE